MSQRLERALGAARRLDLTPADMPRAVRAVRLRAEMPQPSSWPWRVLLFGAGSLMGAAAALLLVITPSAPALPAVVQLGERVAASATDGLAVRRADAGATEVEVLHGAVTFRLFAGASPHRLEVRAGERSFTASGTVYTVALHSGAPAVLVHEGTVEMRAGGEAVRIAAGARWPADATFGPEVVAQRAVVTHFVPRRAAVEEPAVIATKPAETLEEQWRRARLLRGRAKSREAAELLARIAPRATPRGRRSPWSSACASSTPIWRSRRLCSRPAAPSLPTIPSTGWPAWRATSTAGPSGAREPQPRRVAVPEKRS